MHKFLWKNIVPQYGVPHIIITKNIEGSSYIKSLSSSMSTSTSNTLQAQWSIPKSNGQVEATNKVILLQLKKRLNQTKDRWLKDLLEFLWAYRYTPQSSTKETPFSLTYDTNIIIYVKSNNHLLAYHNSMRSTTKIVSILAWTCWSKSNRKPISMRRLPSRERP